MLILRAICKCPLNLILSAIFKCVMSVFSCQEQLVDALDKKCDFCKYNFQLQFQVPRSSATF